MCSSEWRYDAISTVSSAARACARAPSSGRDDGDGRDPELAARAEDAQRDLAAVRYEELSDAHCGPALLEERAQALLALVARPPLRDPPLGAERVRPVEHELLRVPRGLRARGPQLRDHPLDRRVEVARDLLDEPDPQRRGRVEPLAGDEVAPRGARADLRQRERRDHRRDDPELDLGERELRLGPGDRDVRAGDEPAAAAERVALDAPITGAGHGVDRLEHHPQPPRVGDVLLVAELDRGPHPVDVGAGAEARPVAREHDRARVADVGERLGQLGDQLGVERVAPVRPRHRHAQGVRDLLDAQRSHAPHPKPSHRKVARMLRGALAAAVTPLRDDGAALDEEAFRPYLDFLSAGGLDGILALGTTGEGILLSAAERRRAAELFVDGPLPTIVHCGAQTTAETVALAEHAAASGRRAWP